jgi:hypothetical protein
MRDGVSLRWQAFISLSLAAVLALTGCASSNVRKPTRAEIQTILDGEKSLVLFRVTQSELKQPQLQKPARGAIVFWPLDAGPTNKSSSRNITWLERSVSIHASTNGWRFAVVPPGNYFLQLEVDQFGTYEHDGIQAMVPRRGENVPADWRKKVDTNACYAFGRSTDVPAYFLRIPPGKSVVYAGSFQFTNWVELVPDWPLGFTSKREHIDLHALLDESAEAKEIIAESLPEFGEACSSVAVPFDYPPIPVSLNQVEVLSGGASAYATSRVGKAPADLTAAPLSVPGGLLVNEGVGAGNIAGIVLLFGAVAIHSAVDATVGSATRKNWSEHEKALVTEYVNYRLEQKLTDALRERRDAPEASPAYSLQLTPYRACLRKTRRGRYALEVAVHVKLMEKSSGNLVWENFLVYSDWEKASKASSDYLNYPFETLVPSSSTARPLDQYTGADGMQLFQAELAKAVASITAEIESRLH